MTRSNLVEKAVRRHEKTKNTLSPHSDPHSTTILIEQAPSDEEGSEIPQFTSRTEEDLIILDRFEKEDIETVFFLDLEECKFLIVHDCYFQSVNIRLCENNGRWVSAEKMLSENIERFDDANAAFFRWLEVKTISKT